MPEKKAVTSKGYFWKHEDKQRAVATYVATGSFTRTAAITGIPESSVRLWAKQDWWDEEVRRADRLDTDELKTVFTKIAKRATEELVDRIEHGDEVITKDGTPVRKKIGGKDLAVISGISADQRKKQLDAPHLVATQNSQEKLLSLMEQFLKFAKAKEIKHKENDNEIIVEVSSEVEGIDSGSDRPDQGDTGDEAGGTSNPSGTYEASGSYDSSIPTSESLREIQGGDNPDSDAESGEGFDPIGARAS